MKASTVALILLLVSWAALVAAAVAMNPDEYSHVGNKKCFPCHMKEFKSWKETKMARAYEILKPGERAEAKEKAGLDPDKDYTADAECLRCHVTGYGKPGGFADIEKTPDLAGVGCESCHGAGGEYIKDPYMSLKNKDYKLEEVIAAGLVNPVTEEMCTPCHNEESPFYKPFDFQERKGEGIHELFPLRFKHD